VRDVYIYRTGRMLDAAGWAWLQGGFGALVALGVWLVFTGRLVPRSTVKDLRKDRDERVAEARAETTVWREAYEASNRANEALYVQLNQMLEVGHTTTSVLRSLPPGPPTAADPDPNKGRT
jgi:hypothetical protein